MRLTLFVSLTVLVLALVGFALTNADERVTVRLWTTTYHDVHLIWIVVGSMVVGVCFAGLIALLEGAATRLTNHRLRRDVRKLETEINYLRTQPPTAPLAETPPAAARPVTAIAPLGGRSDDPASAPVYGAVDEIDPEDDAYSGGRAV